jgi:hypothetical protein
MIIIECFTNTDGDNYEKKVEEDVGLLNTLTW